MEFLVDLISSIIPYIKTAILAIIPLGFIIFIHELGHFYAAKRCGIKVNTFSLGFGPKLIGFQRGETEYKISLLPFGGYVQMEGENPSEQTGAPGEFASAPLGSRAFVVAAGPVVNLLFGVLIYWLVFATGLNADSARLVGGLTGLPLGEKGPIQIGWVAEDGAGARGGLMPDDTIVSVNGDSVSHWAMFQTRIYTSANRVIELVVERNGKRETLLVKPDAEPSVRGDIGVLSVSSKMETIAGHVREGSLAAEAGIQVGDQIESINGERLYNVPYFGYLVWHPSANWIDEKYKAFYERINANQEALRLGIRRGDETFTLEIPVHWRVTAAVQKGSVAEDAGIRNGDVLVTLNGEEIDKTTLHAQLEAMANEPIEIGLMRDGNLQKVILAAENQSPETKTDGLLFGLAWQVSLSGIEFSEKAAPLPEYNLFTGLGKGVEATWLTFTTVGRTLQQLVGGEVSPKHLAGPIGIANATSRMFDRVGLSSVLFFIGFISINLCIVNLLPIPIADGGHLLFFAVEKIRGRPMPRKAQEVVQQVCIVLLIALFLYITWFDGMSLIYDLRN
ncbi:MAG: RIP metalloprotease RseP [Candidatus Poribacteria bacterium]|nr:RIP metalloprotease RseP [Candidatus Poribacteria bacterium]MDD9975064.1 RIP metalloprotease RseP [Candidatus Poribacteria bacterium]